MKPLLVGEANPYGADPRYALYPLPARASGHRLCTLVMGLGLREYLERFDRVNLCPGRWSAPVARVRARELLAEQGRARIVLLGSKVCGAFGVPYEPFCAFIRSGDLEITWLREVLHYAPDLGNARAVVVLPHPSGICRAWNHPAAFAMAREALSAAGVLPPQERVR